MNGWIRRLLCRLRGGGPATRGRDDRKRRLDREIEEELGFHIEMRTRENLSAGMSPEEARRRAAERFGELERVHEESHHIRRRGSRVRGAGSWLSDLRQDARFALRSMCAAPATTAIALLALTLGIGATTAVFSVVNGVLLRALPYEDAGRLVVLAGQAISRQSVPTFRSGLETLESLGFFTLGRHELVGPDGARSAGSIRVSEGFLGVLGVQPAVGRDFGPDDFAADAPAVVLISDRMWRESFGADPGVVGASLSMDGLHATVIGVMPPGFTVIGYTSYELLEPLGDGDPGMAIGRLRAGVDFERGRAEALALASGFDVENYGLDERFEALYYRSIYQQMTGDDRSGVLFLAGAVSLVILVACANVANLLLARSFSRRGEIAMRAALGAGRGRLLRQLLTESGLLALFGGGTGVLVAVECLPFLLSLVPLGFARAREITIDLRVLGFALVLSLLTSVLFGLAPATAIRGLDLKEPLTGAGRRAGGARRGRRLLDGLVVAEIALALVLLVGTGLLVRTFLTLRPTAPGFDPKGKLAFQLHPPERRYPDAASLRQFYDRVLDELRRLPGAEDAAAISAPPMVGLVWPRPAAPEGMDPAGDGLPTVWFETASANYHQLMDIAIVRGRGLADRPGGLPEMVISERAARGLFPESDPLGKRVTLPDPFHEVEDQAFVVVGIAADTRRLGGSTTPRPTVWVRYRDAIVSGRGITDLTFLVQARGRPEELAGPVRELIAELDPELPILSLQTMDQILYDSNAVARFYMVLMSSFGGIAILLAAIGFYGVMSYAVGRRSHELGVRVALGASAASIRWMVVRQGAVITAIGIGIGLAGCVASAGVLESLLYGISPTDPLTYGVLVAVVAAVSLLACYVPARRATRIDPLAALRNQ